MRAKPAKQKSRGFWSRLIQRRPIDPNRPFHVGLALACLVAGILALFNLDRTLHLPQSHDLSFNASQHGWPMIYLQREFDPAIPNHVRLERTNDWPWPNVEGETRQWNLTGLLVNSFASAVLILMVFFIVRATVKRLSPETA